MSLFVVRDEALLRSDVKNARQPLPLGVTST